MNALKHTIHSPRTTILQQVMVFKELSIQGIQVYRPWPVYRLFSIQVYRQPGRYTEYTGIQTVYRYTEVYRYTAGLHVVWGNPGIQVYRHPSGPDLSVNVISPVSESPPEC